MEDVSSSFSSCWPQSDFLEVAIANSGGNLERIRSHSLLVALRANWSSASLAS